MMSHDQIRDLEERALYDPDSFTRSSRPSKPQPQLVSAGGDDRLLSVADAAARLGVSKDYLYRHAKKLPFARRMGRKLLFSSVGINEYIKRGRY